MRLVDILLETHYNSHPGEAESMQCWTIAVFTEESPDFTG